MDQKWFSHEKTYLLNWTGSLPLKNKHSWEIENIIVQITQKINLNRWKFLQKVWAAGKWVSSQIHASDLKRSFRLCFSSTVHVFPECRTKFFKLERETPTSIQQPIESLFNQFSSRFPSHRVPRFRYARHSLLAAQGEIAGEIRKLARYRMNSNRARSAPLDRLQVASLYRIPANKSSNFSSVPSACLLRLIKG